MDGLEPNLYWRKDTKYYRIILQKDLFGGVNVVCVWGRVGTDNGGYKIVLCDTEHDLDSAISRIKKRRKYRGYTETEQLHSI